MASTPFAEHEQLNDELCVDGRGKLHSDKRSLDALPGQPRVGLDPHQLEKYLSLEFSTPNLDQLAPKLWLVATPRSSHISPLHHQAVRGRSIVITEKPELHLVWYYNKIFIKPIPRYMLSYAFWQYLAAQPVQFRRSAIGFMRTYTYLIRYETDFTIAQEKGLIPPSGLSGQSNAVTWEDFARLIGCFERFQDAEVCPRYSYGELRLTRLNFWSRIFLRKLTFHHIDAQWGPFLSGFLTPFLSIFAVLAITLNAMQVELTVQAMHDPHSRWILFSAFSKYFSVVVVFLVASLLLFLLILVVTMLVHDMCFAARVISAKRRDADDRSWKRIKSGVV